MTSFAPLADRVLAALHAAALGSYAPRTTAERYDLDVARSMTVEQRLNRLDEILRFVEEQRPVSARMEHIRHGELRM